jgi:heptaprenylglyceryl phosphate synthase
VPPATIRAVRGYVGVPLIVGGGLRSAADAAAAREAGADIVVVGSALEGTVSEEKVRAFARAIHGERPVPAAIG